MSRVKKRAEAPEETSEAEVQTAPENTGALPTEASESAQHKDSQGDAPSDAEVVTQVATDLGVSTEDVQVDGDVIVLSGEAAEQAGEEAQALPDHLVPRISLTDYAALRRVTPFQQAILERALGAHDRPFEDWEQGRQSVLGG